MKTALTSMFALLISLSAAPVARADSDLAYYQQFLYSSSTNADGNATTRFLMSTSQTNGMPTLTVGPDAQGNTILADISLFLLNDGTYVAKYMEMTSTGAPVIAPGMFPDMKLTGNWSVPENQLLVGDLATGTRTVYETRNAVQLTFLKDLNTPGLKGKTVVLDYGFSNETPDQP